MRSLEAGKHREVRFQELPPRTVMYVKCLADVVGHMPSVLAQELVTHEN